MKTLALIFSLLIAAPAYAGVTGWTNGTAYLRRLTQVVNTYPFYVSAWGTHDGNTGAGTAVFVGLSTDHANHRRGQLRVQNNNATAAVNDAGGFSQASSTSNVPTAGAWFHLSGDFVSTTLRSARHSGANQGDNTTTRDPSASDGVWVGARITAEGWRVAEGLAEVSIWNTAGMSEVQRESLDTKLANGENPINIRNEVAQPWTGRLVAYYVMADTTDINDVSGNGHHLSTVGTLSNHASHPTIDPVASPARARSQTIFVD